MKKVLDTNVLLDYPQIVTKDTELWVIPLVVLKEIDGLKMNINPETSRKARKAAVFVAKNMDNIIWDFTVEGSSVDNILLDIVAKDCDSILVTNDVSLKVIAKAKGIPVEGYSWKDDYTGVLYVDPETMDVDKYNEILSKLINTGEYDKENYKFSPGEYLIVPPYCTDDKSKSTIFKYNSEGFFEQVPLRQTIKNHWIDTIRPRNDEQICLFDLLNSNIPVVYAGGSYGTGKSFLTHNYAIGELEAQRIKKIVYVPNNAYAQDSMELGFLPGDSFEKLIPSIGPLIDQVGIDQINRWIANEELEIVPLAFMRGRSFNDAIILVSEAENLTESHIKLLISRCGENTRIFFDGDIDQADSAIFKDRNGLKLLLNLHKTEMANLFGTVFLTKIERSKTAELANTLDEL
ncbi:MAG: PhoH family protein [Eubacterium sp.]|nr:PhoH family protein [Eubacterium sp.]